jgi:hypothetical protein
MPFDFVKTICETNPGKDAKGNYIGADIPPYIAKASAFVTFMADAAAILNDKSGPDRDYGFDPIKEHDWKMRQLKYPNMTI